MKSPRRWYTTTTAFIVALTLFIYLTGCGAVPISDGDRTVAAHTSADALALEAEFQDLAGELADHRTAFTAPEWQTLQGAITAFERILSAADAVMAEGTDDQVMALSVAVGAGAAHYNRTVEALSAHAAGMTTDQIDAALALDREVRRLYGRFMASKLEATMAEVRPDLQAATRAAVTALRVVAAFKGIPL